MRLPRMLEPLRIRDFALLWTGMTTSLVGDFVFLVAYPWLTYQLTSNPATLGWISAAVLRADGDLPDRRRRAHRPDGPAAHDDRCRFASSIATGTGAVLAITHHLTLVELGVVVAVGGFGQALFAPAFGSIVPEIVPRESLAQANSLDQFIRTSAGLIGPGIAGVVIAFAGAGWAFAIDAATFVVSTGTALALTPRPFERREKHRSALREMREGFGFVRAHTWLWATLIAGAFANIASASRNVLLPFVIKYDLHASARALGFIYSAGIRWRSDLGARTRTAWSAATARSSSHTSAGACRSLRSVPTGSQRTLPSSIGVGFVAGAGMSIGNGIWGTLMHQLVPRELLGRVTSIDWMMSLSLMPVAAAASGAIAGAVSARATLLGAGLLGGGVCVLFLLLSPALRRPQLRAARRARRALARPQPRRLRPRRLLRRELRQRRLRVHRRDPAVEAQVVGLRREATRRERRLERPVLAQDAGCRLRPDAARARDAVGRSRRAAR